MIRTRPAAGLAVEGELAASVIDTLLREDYAGLSGHVRTAASGPVLDLPGGRGLVLPLRADGFLTDLRIARPGPPLTLEDVSSALEAICDAPDAEGVAAFGVECGQALAALRLRRRHLPAVRATLRQADPGGWLGAEGMVRYDALAAAMPHPAYPTAACRLGFSDEDSLRYAPEYLPEFELRWVAIPRTAIQAGPFPRPGPARRPAWWPEMTAGGLPARLAATHDLMPVHPLTARRALADALAAAGGGVTDDAVAEAGDWMARDWGVGGGRVSGGRGDGGRVSGEAAAEIAPGSWLRVRPTLSTRTVAVADHPGEHLKLPLPVSTLGLRNRRALGPGTLADGALVGRVLAGLAAGDDGLGGRPARDGGPGERAAGDGGPGGLLVADDGPGARTAGDGGPGGLLVADDGDFAHAGHPCLGYLLRRLPGGLGRCRIVPVAALLARSAERPREGSAGGRLVLDDLASAGFGGEPLAFFRAYLDLLFGVQVRLFVRYGIALESHQQNAAVVLGPGGELGLLVKDFDGALINHDRLAAALGPAAPDPSEFADPRLLTRADDALADVFITISVHLCAGAIAFGLAERGYAPLAELLAMIRRALTAALDRCGDAPAARVLRARVLEADRWPGKAMVTAGTLRDKSRTGARDINKFYGTTGPNYLRMGYR